MSDAYSDKEFSLNLDSSFIDSPLLDSPTKIDNNSKTVMVRCLPKGTTPDDLFRLFGMYGNVMKVKIFYKNPENGLVQFQECN
mmetsp:Transcript_7317/g.6655  ORF Transcript_7317/g.6655 Transcript_7317/m.6655 type:complete len:83 (-) Transcript_7317:1485-1733(-)